jgi:hypothetical protein
MNKVPKRAVIIRTQKMNPDSKFSMVIRISHHSKIKFIVGSHLPKIPHETRKEANRIALPTQTNHRVFHLTLDKCIKMSTEANRTMFRLNGTK